MAIDQIGGNSGGLDFNSTSKLAERTAEMEKNLEALMDDIDPSNMRDILMLQQQLNKTQMAQTLNSTIIKTMKDTTQGAIQKIN
ncbi:MAG: hypothetical protein OXD32_05245 [Endozoicomonadaceae bacterium]|nr:hypothetical protein [Endozoicomonadaceae bacterium]MCY4329900.1 hypothetical protein [Endozoicomonadaceae bacterium]